MKVYSYMDDESVLREACRRIDEILLEDSYGKQEKFSLNWSQESQKVETESPSVIVMKALAADIRHFTASGSPLHFKKIIDILKRGGSKDDIEKLKVIHAKWKKIVNNKHSTSGLQLQVGSAEIGNFELMDIINNGDIFHSDDRSLQKLTVMRGSPMMGMAHFNYMLLLHQLVLILHETKEDWINPRLKE